MNVVRFLPHKMWAKTIGSASLLLSSLLRHSLSLVEHSITELNTIEFLHRIPIIHKYAQNSSYHDGCRNFWSDIQKYIRFKIRFEIFKVFLSKSDVTHLTSITPQPNLPLPACMPYLWTAPQTQHGNFNPPFIT